MEGLVGSRKSRSKAGGDGRGQSRQGGLKTGDASRCDVADESFAIRGQLEISLAAVDGAFRAPDQFPLNEFLHHRAGGGAGEAEGLGYRGNGAGHAHEFKHRQLRGGQVGGVQERQGPAGIVAMHLGEEVGDLAREICP